MLNVRDLLHRYGQGAAIALGSFSLDRGAALVVRGASGCGKSTLLHLLAGVLPVAATGHGSVQLAGRELAGLPRGECDRLRPFTVGWMPQRQFMISSLSVIENLLLPVALARPVDATIRARAAALLQALGIEALAERRPADVSVGQAARLSLARALLATPALLVADEPTAALDAASTGLAAQVIAAHLAAGGSAVIASHDGPLADLLRQACPDGRVRELALPALSMADPLATPEPQA